MFLDLVNQEKKIFMYHFVCMHCTFDVFFMYIFFLVVDVFINKFVAFVVKFFLMVLGHTGIFSCVHMVFK